MTRTLRLLLLAAALVTLASGVALSSASGASSDSKQFEARFQESNVSVTNRIADLGLFQLMNTGTGTVDGFGPATMMLAMSQDRSVTPCGPGSWTNAGIRRIVVAAGVLILRNKAFVCQTAAGPVATAQWQVDGDVEHGGLRRRPREWHRNGAHPDRAVLALREAEARRRRAVKPAFGTVLGSAVAVGRRGGRACRERGGGRRAGSREAGTARAGSAIVATIELRGAPSGMVMAAGVALGLAGRRRRSPASIPPRTEIVARIQPGGVSLAAGFGSIWAVDIFADVLLRIDPETNRITRSDPGRGPADRDRDRPRLGLGREPARLDRLPGLARDRPDSRDDPAGPGRDLARRDRCDIRTRSGRSPGTATSSTGSDPRPRPSTFASRSGRTRAHRRARLGLGRHREQRVAPPDQGRRGRADRGSGPPCRRLAAPTGRGRCTLAGGARTRRASQAGKRRQARASGSPPATT